MTKQQNIISFKYKDKLIDSTYKDLDFIQIEIIKLKLSYMYQCHEDEICVECEEIQYSELDVCMQGLFDWKDINQSFISGIKLIESIEDNDLIEAYENGTIEKYLEFI